MFFSSIAVFKGGQGSFTRQLIIVLIFFSMAAEEDCEQVRKIFVGGLNRITDDEGLRNFFLPWGTIVDFTVMRDVQGISRGFGFVTFDTSEPVDNLMKAKRKGQKFNLDDTDVEIKRAFPKSSGSHPGERLRDAVNRTRKIFVGGIPSTTSEGDLRSYFDKFGAVSEVEILYDKVTQRMRGFAFVTFEDEDAADKVCQVRDHKIKMKLCEVKKAESRSSIKMRQERQGPPGGMGGGRGGYHSGHHQGGGNMGNPNYGGFGGGNPDLSGLSSGLAALQALGLTGSILQNLLAAGGGGQGPAGGGMQGNRQGSFGNQQGGNFGGNFGGGSGGNPNNPLALLSALGNMGGQLNNLGNLGNLGNLLNLAGLANLAQGSGNLGGTQQQQSSIASTSEGGDQYRQQQYSGTGNQQSASFGNSNTAAADDGSYGYGYSYGMGSYSQQQSGYGPMKYQNPGAPGSAEKKNFRPY